MTRLKRLENLDINNMPGKASIRIRKMIFPFTKLLTRCNTRFALDKKVVVDREPHLEKGEQYIFAATNNYAEDLDAVIGTLDRNAWVIYGSTDQLENDPKMYSKWLNGIIYVDRNNDRSRNSAYNRLKSVLDNGGSVLVNPEGGMNNTENELCAGLFPGVCRLANECKKKVVPVAAIYSDIDDKIHVSYGDPIDLSLYTTKLTDSSTMKITKKNAASVLIRDAMGSLMYDLIENNTTPLERQSLTGDIHMKFTEDRVREYMKAPWTGEDELKKEFVQYKPKYVVNPTDVDKEINLQDQYERMLMLTLERFVQEYCLSRVEALQMFEKMKFAKKPSKVCDLLMKMDETMCDCDSFSELEKLEIGDVEPFLGKYRPKRISYQDDVWNFVNSVNLTEHNAKLMGKIVGEVEQEQQDKERRSLDYCVDHNFHILNLERKNRNKKSKIRE